jgi:hypothetical protein
MVLIWVVLQSALKKVMCGFFSSVNSSARHILVVELEGSPAFHTSCIFSAKGVSSAVLHHLVSHWQPNDVPPTQYCPLGTFLAENEKNSPHIWSAKLISRTQKLFFGALQFSGGFKGYQVAVLAASLLGAPIKIVLTHMDFRSRKFI